MCTCKQIQMTFHVTPIPSLSLNTSQDTPKMDEKLFYNFIFLDYMNPIHQYLLCLEAHIFIMYIWPEKNLDNMALF